MWFLSIFKCQKSPTEAEINQNEVEEFITLEHKKLLLWSLLTLVLTTACLSHVFAAPFLTYEPEMVDSKLNISEFKGIDPLEKTLWHDFDEEAKSGHNHHHHHIDEFGKKSYYSIK